jgi:hypothetical protein
MATTTPNFGWPVPTSTDLVKDGATAIEALGDSIDASLLDLKGGTTGQVLSKTSGTDMDFTWVTSDDANAIQNTIVDAKGDLIAATAADTPARLAVGTNGQVLTADSTAATGLSWATSSSGGMTSIASGSLTGSSISMTSISQSYKNLQLVLTDFYPSTDTYVYLRFNNASVANSYSHLVTVWNGAASSVTGGLYSLMYLTWNNLDSGNFRNFMVCDIYDYTNTTSNKQVQTNGCYVDTAGTAYVVETDSNMWNQSTPEAINRIDISVNAGTFSGGTYTLYGVK